MNFQNRQLFLCAVLYLLYGIHYATAATEYEPYMGVSYGITNLNYDIKGEAYQYVVNEVPQENAAISLLGGTLQVQQGKSSTAQKIYYGFKFKENLGIEMFYLNITEFSLEARGNVGIDETVLGYRARASANGLYSVTAKMYGIGGRLNVFGQVSKRVEFFAGAGIMATTATIRTRSVINTAYGINDDLKYSSTVRDDTDTKRGILPVLSVGSNFKITESFGARVEYEFIGNPVSDDSIGILSAGLQYAF